MADQELEAFVQELIAKGESPDVINSVIDQWDAKQSPATPGVTMTATTPMGRATNALNNLQGLPGILVGAANEGLNMARGTWNMLVPESMEVANPDRPDTNPYQVLGARGLQGAMAVESAAKVPGIIAKAGGMSKARAGANLESVRERVNLVNRMNPEQGVRVSGQGTQQAVTRAQELRAVGAYTPASVTKLARKLSEGGDLSFQEASDFASRFSQLSVDEMRKMTPQMSRQISEIAATLRAGLTEAAASVGRGAQYEQGISEYARAKRLEDAWAKAWPLIKKGLIAGGGGAVGWRGLQSLTDGDPR